VLATLISSGKKGHETVPGRWAVWLKTRHDRMHGRDYDLEEVPWSMYFHDDQALHGAFWHDRFGHQLTHGCVNLSVADAAWLFEWTSPDVPAGWHSAAWTTGLPVTAVLVEKRIAPEDRLRPIRSLLSYTR
jgi:L,D-transpeptidase-like protein